MKRNLLNLFVIVTFFTQGALSTRAVAQVNGSPVLNPTTLRTTLLTSNNSILVALNKVHQAKDQVNIARANLLPSLNISAIFSPNFLISSISFLLPFLMPSNWLTLKEDKFLLQAEEGSYYLAELNQYASAYALYETVIGDIAIRDILEEQYENYLKIDQLLEQQQLLNGTVSSLTLAQARAQTQMAAVQVAQSDKLLAQENAAIRELFDLSIDVPLNFDQNAHVPASESEESDIQTLANQALAIAPENTQIDNLISASRSAKWAKMFGFLSSSTLSNTSQTGASLAHLSQGAGFSIGFGIVPNLALSNDNTAELLLQKDDLKNQTTVLAEKTLNSIVQAKKQVALATEAVQNLKQAYQIELQTYRLGLTDFLHVIEAQNQMTQASVSRVQNQIDLDNLRINLHRMMLTDQFAQIVPCKTSGDSNSTGFFGRVFGHREPQLTLDQACKPQTATP